MTLTTDDIQRFGRYARTDDVAGLKTLYAVHGRAIVEARDEQGFTALHWTAMIGSENATRFLLERGAQMDVPDSLSGKTAVHRAAEDNFLSVLSLLVSYGANKNAVDEDGNTPLHLACNNMCVETTSFLLTSGVDTDVLNKEEHTAYDLAVLSECTPLMEMFQKVETANMRYGLKEPLKLESKPLQLRPPHKSLTKK